MSQYRYDAARKQLILTRSSAAPQDPDAPVYRLPKLNAAIRDAVKTYGAVFPKLNWTAPRVGILWLL